MNPTRGRRPERIGDLVRERIAALGWGLRLREEEVLTGWGEAVGPQIAAHARASHVVNHRLTVVTENPVWTQQLALLKPDLLRRLAGRFGPEAVTDLFFVTGRIDPLPAPPAPAAAAVRQADLPAEFRGELDAIGDGGVRESVRRLILAALAADSPAD
jgi:hypothetical protein